jgi:hypothetical protein
VGWTERSVPLTVGSLDLIAAEFAVDVTKLQVVNPSLRSAWTHASGQATQSADAVLGWERSDSSLPVAYSPGKAADFGGLGIAWTARFDRSVPRCLPCPASPVRWNSALWSLLLEPSHSVRPVHGLLAGLQEWHSQRLLRSYSRRSGCMPLTRRPLTSMPSQPGSRGLEGSHAAFVATPSMPAVWTGAAYTVWFGAWLAECSARAVHAELAGLAGRVSQLVHAGHLLGLDRVGSERSDLSSNVRSMLTLWLGIDRAFLPTNG